MFTFRSLAGFPIAVSPRMDWPLQLFVSISHLILFGSLWTMHFNNRHDGKHCNFQQIRGTMGHDIECILRLAEYALLTTEKTSIARFIEGRRRPINIEEQFLTSAKDIIASMVGIKKRIA